MRIPLLTFALGLGLTACEAPWEAWPSDATAPDDAVWVTGLLVAGEPFDSIAFEAPTSIALTYDHTAQPCLEGSTVMVVRTDSADTIRYVPSSDLLVSRRTWHAVDPTRRVAYGARYRLVADLVRSSGTVDHLVADTYTPSFYRLPDSARVPMEALDPRLSVGFSPDSLARLVADSAFRATVWSQELDVGGRLSGLGLGMTDFVSYLGGKAAYGRLPRGGSVWYVYDTTLVDAIQLNPAAPTPRTQRSSLSMIFPQTIDKPSFGGLLTTWRFDTSGSVVQSIKVRGPGSGGGPGSGKGEKDDEVDSAKLYPLGLTRGLQFQDALGNTVGAQSFSLVGTLSLPWFPTINLVAVSRLSITGRLTYRSYAVDSNAIAHEASFQRTGADGATAVYSNVRGGAGLFAGAVVDSFPFVVHSARGDTLPISALRGAWCRDNLPKGPTLQLSAQDLSGLCP